MSTILYVGAGGFVGAILRYCIAGLINRMGLFSGFPLGTAIVNILGCLCIGFLFGYVENKNGLSIEWQLFLMVGLLGGFTTFSTFGLETLNLIRDSQIFAALVNVMGQVLIGVLCVALGYGITKTI